MPSWSHEPWETDYYGDLDSLAARYQRGVDQRVLLDLVLGVEVPDGWHRPVDPACPRHGYGMVENACGVCVQEASLSGRGLAEARDRMPDVQNAPRPESDEREAA